MLFRRSPIGAGEPELEAGSEAEAPLEPEAAPRQTAEQERSRFVAEDEWVASGVDRRTTRVLASSWS